MRIGIGLLTLVPGRVGGSETYVRGLLAGLAAEASPHRWTAFANPAAARSLEASAGGAVAVRSVPEYDPGEGRAAASAILGRWPPVAWPARWSGGRGPSTSCTSR